MIWVSIVDHGVLSKLLPFESEGFDSADYRGMPNCICNHLVISGIDHDTKTKRTIKIYGNPVVIVNEEG